MRRTLLIGCAVAGLGTIHFSDLGRLIGQVHQLRHASLHAKGHFVLRDPRGNLWIVHVGQLLAVKGLDAVEKAAAVVARYTGRIAKEQDRIALAAKLDALIDAGQEAAAPQRVSAAGDFAGDHDDVRRKVAVLAAQAI